MRITRIEIRKRCGTWRNWLSGATTAAEAFEGAREAIRRGFHGLKWSPFRSEELRANENAALARAAELMAAAREGAGPDVEIYIECSERLSPRTAARAAGLFAPFSPAWFEEPLPFENPEELCRLQREIAVPIASGERRHSRWEEGPPRDSLRANPARFTEGCFELPAASGPGSDLVMAEIEGQELRPQPSSNSSESLRS